MRSRVALAPNARAPAPHARAPGPKRLAGAASPISKIQRVKAGDVLVSDVSPAAPFGYLRRVTSVARGNGEVVLQTVQARLDEAIKSAPFTQATVVMVPGSAKATLMPGALAFPASAPA